MSDNEQPLVPTSAPHPRPFFPRSGEKGELPATAVRAPRPAHWARGWGEGGSGLGVKANVG